MKPAGHLSVDVEGVTLVDTGSGGYLIASAQNIEAPKLSYFTVYDRITNDYLGSFRIMRGGGADGCQRTDGVMAYAGDLGPSYPQGVVVCQDNGNTAPFVGNQDSSRPGWTRSSTSAGADSAGPITGPGEQRASRCRPSAGPGW